jgi:murein DD-endopeptidase MepM/ murein hydrolase activator NlpD
MSRMPGWLAVCVSLLLFAFLTASASAVGEPITISPTSGPPGTTVTVNGSGWQGYSDVPIQIDGKTLATAHPDANGNFSVRITIPESATPGSRVRIDALYGNGGSANAWFNVTESGGGTGSGIDLEVTKIDPLGQRICAGSNVTFRASIRNNSSSESGFFNIRWIADNAKKFDGGHYSIPAKATDTHDHIWKNPSAGKHTLEFIADFDKQKSETDEKNNQFTLPFSAEKCSTGQQPSTGQQFKFPWDSSKTLAYTGGPHEWPPATKRSGLDFSDGSKSTHILAMADGKVTFVGDEECHKGACKTVKVSHENGWEVWYVHLSSFQSDIAKECKPSCSFPVKLGQWLGNEGNTGTSGVHIHIELRKNGKPVPWHGHSIDGWQIHEKCDGFKESYNDNTVQPDAICQDTNSNGYISGNRTHVVPLDSSKKGAQQYSLESTNQEK